MIEVHTIIRMISVIGDIINVKKLTHLEKFSIAKMRVQFTYEDKKEHSHKVCII